ncbi:MAG TPA: DUF4124 domain-containing protein [Syntrophales bacterium]|nr:DUF4124 domain-containing protein [Syntrophales bacterium]
MSAHKYSVLIPAVPLMLVLSVWIALSGEVYGGTIYQYIDKDGSTVITDNPPEGVSAKPVISQPDATVEQQPESAKDDEAMKQKNLEADAQRLEKDQKIKTAREELEKAKSDADHYRSNMNQSANFSQRRHWRSMLDEQEKAIEEKQKLINELEAQP